MSWLALIRPGDLLILLAGVGAVGISAPLLWQGGLADRAIIRQEGRVFAEVDLRSRKQFEVPVPLGTTLIAIEPGQGLTLMFESFGFKHGLPLDADLVFDVRCLPNPHYDPELRPLTDQDQPVIASLAAEPEVCKMRDDISRFIAEWLPSYIRDNHNYLTVAIGCTGGQHRSVYIAEWLSREFASRARVLVRHRTLAGN